LASGLRPDPRSVPWCMCDIVKRNLNVYILKPFSWDLNLTKISTGIWIPLK